MRTSYHGIDTATQTKYSLGTGPIKSLTDVEWQSNDDWIVPTGTATPEVRGVCG